MRTGKKSIWGGGRARRAFRSCHCGERSPRVSLRGAKRRGNPCVSLFAFCFERRKKPVRRDGSRQLITLVPSEACFCFSVVGPPPAGPEGPRRPSGLPAPGGPGPKTPRAESMSVLHRSIEPPGKRQIQWSTPSNPAAQRRAATLAGTWQQPVMRANATKRFPPAKAGSRVSPTTSRAPEALRYYGNAPLTPARVRRLPRYKKLRRKGAVHSLRHYPIGKRHRCCGRSERNAQKVVAPDAMRGQGGERRMVATRL